MDFSNMLSYLQNLLGNKQTQQNQEFGSNLGLQQQELGQQQQQFDTTAKNQMSQFAQNLADRQTQEAAQNNLAQQGQNLQDVNSNQNYILAQTTQPPDAFVQKLLSRMAVPKSAITPALGANGGMSSGGVGLLT